MQVEDGGGAEVDGLSETSGKSDGGSAGIESNSTGSCKIPAERESVGGESESAAGKCGSTGDGDGVALGVQGSRVTRDGERGNGNRNIHIGLSILRIEAVEDDGVS